MEITMHEIPIRDIFAGYSDNDEEGVYAYGGKLNVRPKYQREFVYNDADQKAVMDTILKKFPLNVMYWVKNEDGTYEVLDGQQRTLSFCKFLNHDYSIMYNGTEKYIHTLTPDIQDRINDYVCSVYICEGTDSEKLDWFEVINKGGVKLTDQELRNAVYTGEWLTDAKRHFSKTGCPAKGLFGDYLSGEMNRQIFLETALKWIADRDGITINKYMADHQFDKNCNDLWTYFMAVANWVQMIFIDKNKRFKCGLPWGIMYNKYHENDYDAKTLLAQIDTLMKDDEVQNKKGIYEYLLSGDEKFLQLRQFTDSEKMTVYANQAGICKMCGKHFEFEEMEGDHIDPWHSGGKTKIENCQMLCKPCNRRKSGK